MSYDEIYNQLKQLIESDIESGAIIGHWSAWLPDDSYGYVINRENNNIVCIAYEEDPDAFIFCRKAVWFDVSEDGSGKNLTTFRIDKKDANFKSALDLFIRVRNSYHASKKQCIILKFQEFLAKQNNDNKEYTEVQND